MTLRAPVDRRTFSEVSTVTPAGPGRVVAEVDPEWTIGGKPNGGYLLAVMGRAAVSVAAADHDHVVAASAHYLSSPEPGPVEVDAEVLRAGRSASQVQARMHQHGRERVAALFTVSHLASGGAPHWADGLPEPSEVAFDDAVKLDPQLPDRRRVAIMDQVEVRLDPSSAAVLRGSPSGRGELRGWLRLPGDEPFDPISLLYAVDAFPPATFDIEFAGWVPTFELTVYVRALPGPGPVRILQRAHLIDGQRVDESCWVWDGTGRPVAQGTQLAGVRLG